MTTRKMKQNNNNKAKPFFIIIRFNTCKIILSKCYKSFGSLTFNFHTCFIVHQHCLIHRHTVRNTVLIYLLVSDIIPNIGDIKENHESFTNLTV